MNMSEIPLATLAQMRLDAKAAEDRAVSYRRDIDNAIALALKDRDEGTVSTTLDGFKVSVTYKLTRKVDTTALQNKWEFIPENVQKAFTWKADVVTKHLKALQELSADLYAQAAQFVETKPASPSVTVEVKE